MRVFDDKTAPYQIPFEAYGTEVRICTNSRELLAHVEPMIPPRARSRPRSSTQRRVGVLDEGDDFYSVYNDDICVHDAHGLAYALLMVDTQIHGLIALDSPDYIFVHAGVVAADRRAIVMPGLSFAGKTTLVRALVEAGAVYYSDEFAVLDLEGLVHPYPRPLTVRMPQAASIDYPVEELGGVAGTEPIEVGMVVATHFRPGAEWDPEELSQGAGALAVFEHAVPARERPEQTLRVIKGALNGATILRGERGEADDIAPLLLGALRSMA
jgi:hypothetical protein